MPMMMFEKMLMIIYKGNPMASYAKWLISSYISLAAFVLDGGQQQRAALKRCRRFRVGIATEFDSQNERSQRGE